MRFARRTPASRMRLPIAAALLGMAVWRGTAQEPATAPVDPAATDVERTAPAADVPPSTGARLTPDQAIPLPDLEAFVDGVVQPAMEADHLVGLTISVVQGGQTVLKKGYGFADLGTQRRVDPDLTLFQIGSITKTFTWIALMTEVEAGRVGLDDPVNLHLPADLQLPDQGRSEPIRIRHLMTHAPGFEDRALGGIFVRDPANVRLPAVTVREHRPDRVREPGVLSSYSNYGVLIAGAIVEHTARQDWNAVVESRILAPLGLMHTSTREPYPPRPDLPRPMEESLAQALAVGYRWTGAAHQPRDFTYVTQMGPAGAMSSTAGDMARYMLMLLNDGVLDGATVFGPQAAKAFRTRMTSRPASVGNWAAGFFEGRLPGGFATFGHDGATLAFFSSMVLVPELRLGIFVSTNTEGGSTLTSALPGRIVERFYAPPSPPPAGRSDLIASAAVYSGEYLTTRRRHSGLEGFLGRLQPLSVSVTPDGYLRAFDQRYVPGESPDEFVAVGSAGPFRGLRFIREGDRAERVESAAVSFERQNVLYQNGTMLVLAGLTLAMSLGTLLGARIRLKRGLAQTAAQRLASWLQGLGAVAWLTSAAAIGALIVALNDDSASVLFFDWPHPALLVFSTAALTATVLAGLSILLLPAVWRGSKPPHGWTLARTLRFTVATTVFALLGGVLGLWGALQPWNP